jgi:hypothetical protein
MRVIGKAAGRPFFAKKCPPDPLPKTLNYGVMSYGKDGYSRKEHPKIDFLEENSGRKLLQEFLPQNVARNDT